MALELRATVLALLLTGCSERPLPVRPLPALVSEAPTRAQRVAIAPLWFGGEQLTWDVSWRGVSVGSAHVATGEARAEAPSRLGRSVRSQFRTHGFAARLSSVRHDLATREVDLAPASDRAHTLHSALATVRAWASPERTAGFLIVRFDDATYRLELARPVREASHVRVDCRLMELAGRAQPISIAMWLTDDEHHVPARVEIEDARGRVTARLIERTL